MNELSNIQSKIYEIRGYKVMLDFDLAEMYGVETRRLKEQVRRNIERFEGDDFMFELTKDELSRSQIAIFLFSAMGHPQKISFSRDRHRRTLPSIATPYRIASVVRYPYSRF